jgi:4-amino-4-deoxy-L-arabinose transferase-like glycosyltransferase
MALLSGPADQPRWARPGLLTLLVGTAVLNVWGLSSAGWANPYYAAAVWSGTRSWKALLFASLDPGNGITVDKPPAALWLMGLSGRLFGFGAWSMLVPQALLGVATVGLLYAAVRRCGGPGAGLLAGAALALTPVAALMFRYNNPDALMVFLEVVAAYAVVRSLQSASPRVFSASTGWIVMAGAAIGFGFLAKMMQAFLVLPGLALAMLVAAPGGIWPRLGKLVAAGLAVVVSAGWYVALVQWWPAGSRPFIGGSKDNSLWDLAVNYNGMGRIFGNNHTSARSMSTHVAAMAQAVTHPPMQLPHLAAPYAGGADDGSGLTRLLRQPLATEFSWLLPAALIALVVGLWITGSRARTDTERAGVILWGGWLLGTGAVLSYMNHGFHTYYTIELSPAVAALAGTGSVLLWRHRADIRARLGLAAMAAATGVWAFVLLDHTPGWLPWLRWTLPPLALIAAALLAVGVPRARRVVVVLAGTALLCGLAGPAAYAVQTVALPHSGGSPYSGPVRNDAHDRGHETSVAAPQLDALLSHAGNRWAAAEISGREASSIELSSGASVLAIGGFGGRDDWPTPDRFQQYVAAGDVHYFLVRPRSGDRHGSGGAHQGWSPSADSAAAQITDWVRSHYRPQRIDGYEVYDLTAPAGAGAR